MDTILSELLEALQYRYPRGISFDPMSMRLLRQYVAYDDEQIEFLKSHVLFQLKNNLWYSSEMILDNSALLNLKEQALSWLENYGCFSVEFLCAIFNDEIHNLIDINDWVAFLQFQGFTVTTSPHGYLCTIHDCKIDDILSSIAQDMMKLLDSNDGMISLDIIAERFPSLTMCVLESIRKNFLPRVNITEIRGIRYWSNIADISLPNDFSEKLKDIIKTFQLIEIPLTRPRLELALSLFYKTQFRREYDLLDDDAFEGLCAEYYHGADVFFAKAKKRTKEARQVDIASFQEQSLPIVGIQQEGCEVVGLRGEKLAPTTWASFEKDGTNPVVADWVQRVQSGESPLQIALETGYAMSTVKLKTSNYDLYFKVCQKNGIEPKRQEELQQILEYPLTSQAVCVTNSEQDSPVQEIAQGREIKGLYGKNISPSDWRTLKKDGTDSSVAMWVNLLGKGKNESHIAQLYGISIAIVRKRIRNWHLYHTICKKNKINPERF